MPVQSMNGEVMDTSAAVLVNAWNRNVLPWWLPSPQRAARALRKAAGSEPFRQLGRVGPIPLGGAVVTQAGKLDRQAIIHVAGIDLTWQASVFSIGESTKNALRAARSIGATSIAMPIIGDGTGGFVASNAEAIMEGVLLAHPELTDGIDVTIVRYC